VPKYAITATRIENLYTEVTASSKEEALIIAEEMTLGDFTFDGGEFTIDYAELIEADHRFERVLIKYTDTDETVEVIVSVGGDIEALQKQGLDEHVFYYFQDATELHNSFTAGWDGEQTDFITVALLGGSEDLNA
jgi:hypothetical protein